MKRFDLAPDFVFSPQPMHVIGTRNEDGTPNFCIITWLGFALDKTPHLMMCIGGSKRTKTNILREGMFSANLVSEDNVWLADYLGCTRAEDGTKNAVDYEVEMGRKLPVPTLSQSHWVYECRVTQTLPLDGSDLFLAEIVNIQVDEAFQPLDKERIDLCQLRPAIYAPYRYFSIGEKLGETGEWAQHLPGKEQA